MDKPEKLNILRHSTAHILATAVLEMFPEAKFGIGPAIEDGFYYDFDLPRTLIPEDLPILEEKMREIIKQNLPFECQEIDAKKATGLFKKARQNYKMELIKDLQKTSTSPANKNEYSLSKARSTASKGKQKTVTLYKTGNFVDLCSGPHIDSTGEIKSDSLKLLKISGAYWKGDEKNKMLQRIYGTAWNNKKELDGYLRRLEEAEKRDHRRLGKELDLFTFSDLVGPGLPLYTPKGSIIIEELRKHIEKVCRGYDFERVITPHLAKIDLFELSGHAKKFGEELFHVSSEKGHNFVMKPVQCPHQTQIYASRPRSYKDLPIRYMESEKQYRAEKTGEVGGLNRVYAITVEDGHSFCRVDQVKEEIINMVNIIKDFYSALGLWGNHWVSLSVRDYGHPEKYIGEPKDWDICEKMLADVAKEMKLGAKKMEGEAALYGPKLDFMFKDATGKEIQIPTVQIDFATPKRFSLFYIDEKGRKVPPVMVHRAVLGSYERFLSLIIEHFVGAFPLWLSPIQVEVIPVSDKFKSYGEKIHSLLKENDVRSQVRDSDETLGKRIREAQQQKINYMLIVGEKEMKENSVAVRSREKGDVGTIKIERFIEKIKKEIEEKK